jgi:Arc/MetJ-type ribon-helix-helix transcriptional regulator
MKNNHENRCGQGALRVREPVQVYLEPDDQDRLQRVCSLSSVSKSEALREGLRALERELTSPASHPALQIVGLARGVAPPAGAQGAGEAPDPARDPAVDHDAVLADDEVASWA